MKEMGLTGLNSGGQMTDPVMEGLSQCDLVTRLNLGGSKRLTDNGLSHLANMPQLQELDLSEYPGGADHRSWARGPPPSARAPEISDVLAARHLGCRRGQSPFLRSPGERGSVRHADRRWRHRCAHRQARNCAHSRPGRLVTDAGLPLLHQFPVFKTWQGGEIKYSLMSADAEPNHLLLDGPFTDKGFASIAGLNGLFALSFFWHISALTADGLKLLVDLPNLGFLGCQESSATMRRCSTSPRSPGSAC